MSAVEMLHAKTDIVPARNRRVERLLEAIAHARRQELIDDLGWLFTSELQDADIEETSNLVRQDDKISNRSADVHCVLGRESANRAGMSGQGSDDVPCVLGRESANLIGLKGVAKGSDDVPCVLGRESANLIVLEVIQNELDVVYNEIEMVDHLGTDRVGAGGADQEFRKIPAELATDVAMLAELFNHPIGITNTALDWTKDGLSKAQQCDIEIVPLIKWNETMQDGPERKDVLMFGMTTRSYVQQWDDLHLVEGVLYRIWRSKDGLRQYQQLVAPGDYQRALVRLVHEQGHFVVDGTCEQLRQRVFWYGWKNTVKTELEFCANFAVFSREAPSTSRTSTSRVWDTMVVEWQSISQEKSEVPKWL